MNWAAAATACTKATAKTGLHWKVVEDAPGDYAIELVGAYKNAAVSPGFPTGLAAGTTAETTPEAA